MAETEKELLDLSKQNLDYVLIDAPLLFEANIDKKCDYIISVIAKENIKINRICNRDSITEEIANSRLSVQHNDEFFIQRSDFVIENNQNIENIKMQIERILLNIS